ncbi:MAG: chorismate mutase [Candidatus Freyarchaeota archaeon]
MSEERGEVDELRRQIMDATLDVLKAIRRRVELVERLGEVKRRMGVPLRDLDVEKTVVSRVREEAERMGLDPEFCGKIAEMLIEYSVKVQERIIGGKEG